MLGIERVIKYLGDGNLDYIVLEFSGSDDSYEDGIEREKYEFTTPNYERIEITYNSDYDCMDGLSLLSRYYDKDCKYGKSSGRDEEEILKEVLENQEILQRKCRSMSREMAFLSKKNNKLDYRVVGSNFCIVYKEIDFRNDSLFCEIFVTDFYGFIKEEYRLSFDIENYYNDNIVFSIKDDEELKCLSVDYFCDKYNINKMELFVKCSELAFKVIYKEVR